MTAVTIQTKLPANAADVLAPLADHLFRDPAARIMAVVEFKHLTRTEPAPDEDLARTVTLKITHLEVGQDEQEHALRDAARALYLHRTAAGTLDADGEVELSKDTLRLTAGALHAEEAARLRVGLLHYAEAAREAAINGGTADRLREQLVAIGEGLTAVLNRVKADDDDRPFNVLRDGSGLLVGNGTGK